MLSQVQESIFHRFLKSDYNYYLLFLGTPTKPITNDDIDHILLCLRVLSERPPALIEVYTVECRQALSNMLQSNQNALELANKVIFYYRIIKTMIFMFSSILGTRKGVGW